MVNRDRDLSAVEIDGTTYFVVPEPLAKEWDKYTRSHPGFEPTGEEGSHVKWDYTEWSGPARVADEALDFLYQNLLVMDGGEQD